MDKGKEEKVEESTSMSASCANDLSQLLAIFDSLSNIVSDQVPNPSEETKEKENEEKGEAEKEEAEKEEAEKEEAEKEEAEKGEAEKKKKTMAKGNVKFPPRVSTMKKMFDTVQTALKEKLGSELAEAAKEMKEKENKGVDIASNTAELKGVVDAIKSMLTEDVPTEPTEESKREDDNEEEQSTPLTLNTGGNDELLDNGMTIANETKNFLGYIAHAKKIRDEIKVLMQNVSETDQAETQENSNNDEEDDEEDDEKA